QKLMKAVKNKSETEVNQIKKLKEKLFPGNIPQERVENFSSFYAKYDDFIGIIKKAASDPLSDKKVCVISLV
ncbi:MAG TPA: bacillithiol biosynthesis BshC, partial [Nitrosopumilaceae archaeon]|nr:bacillithiol biosynthesis BshC [Nitrosopumilaceae archaeon]